MGLYAVVKNEIVESIAVSDSPLATDGEWICINDIEPKPIRGWTYKDGQFTETFIPIFIKQTTIKLVLTDQWVKIEETSVTDETVKTWVDKVNSSDELEYNEQFDKDLQMLKSKQLIEDIHVMKLQPWNVFYVSL